MKNYIVPYLVGKAGSWWGGIDIYNYNETSMGFDVKMYRNIDGTLIKELAHVLEPFGHIVLGPDDLVSSTEDGRITVIITGPDDLMVTAFQGTGDSGFGLIPVKEVAVKKL